MTDFSIEQSIFLKYKAALRTLERMGYTWCGGEEFKPPLGKFPEHIKSKPAPPPPHLDIAFIGKCPCPGADLSGDND